MTAERRAPGRTVTSWGRLIARELSSLAPLAMAAPMALSSCAAAPEAGPVAPVNVEPATITSSTTPEPALTPGLTELALALPAPTTPRTRPLRRQRDVRRFGAGELVAESIDWRRDKPACPLKGEGACGLYAVRSGSGPWPAPRRAPGAWLTFSSGASVVYAVREGDSLNIDAIDGRGEVTTWLTDPTAVGLTGVQIVETRKGKVLLAFADQGGAFVAAIVEEGGTRRLGPRQALNLDTADYRPNAQGARAVEANGQRASWGATTTLAMLDAAGKPDGTWALVWTQVIAPPYGVRAGKPWRRREKSSAKHDCGSGPLSRPLSDPSVEKRITLALFDGAVRLSEVVLDHPEKLDLQARPLSVVGFAGGVAVEGVAYDPRGKVQKDAVLPVAEKPVDAPQLAPSVPDEETPSGLAFDRASGEGLVIFRRGYEDAFARRFDARGVFVGEAFPLHDGVGTSGRVVLARVGEAWVGFDAGSHTIAFLTGPRAGTVMASVPAASALGLLPLDATHAMLVTDENARVVVTRTVDLAQGTLGPRTPTAMSHAIAAFVRGRDGAPIAIEAPSLRLFDLRADDYTEAPDAPPKGASEAFDVGGDTVLLWRGPTSATLTWMQAGGVVTHPSTVLPPYDAYRRTEGAFGPVLPSGWVLPATAGPPIDSEAEAATAACPWSVALSPHRALLACSEPTDALVPGVRAGVRVVTY